MSSFFSRIARLVRGATAHNTVNVRTATVVFQKSPGKTTGNDRGISALAFKVLSGGVEIQNGTTPANGAVQVLVHGTTPSIVQWIHNGAVVSEFQVTISDTAYEADTTLAGAQRRLRQLGYQLGASGTGVDGVDGQMGPRTDRAIQQFQADEGLVFDSTMNAGTTTALKNACGGTA